MKENRYVFILAGVILALVTLDLIARSAPSPIGPGSNSAIGPSINTAGNPPPPPVGCNAGQLDWTDATGCNLVFAGH